MSDKWCRKHEIPMIPCFDQFDRLTGKLICLMCGVENLQAWLKDPAELSDPLRKGTPDAQ